MKKTDYIAYIAQSNENLLKTDALELLFDVIYIKNNPQMLIGLTEACSLSKLAGLKPPWGDDMHVFSEHIVRNFLKILLGWMGTQCGADLKYGAWFITDLNSKESIRQSLLELDMTGAVCIYQLSDEPCSMFLYEKVPDVIKCIDPRFRVIK